MCGDIGEMETKTWSNGDYNLKTINPNNPDDDAADDSFMNEIDSGVSLQTAFDLR